jgi:hypothetical protein
MICDSDELFDPAIPSLILPSTPSRDLSGAASSGAALEQGKNGKLNRHLEKNLRQSPAAGKLQVAQKSNFRANPDDTCIIHRSVDHTDVEGKEMSTLFNSPDQPRFSGSTLKMRLCIVRRPLVASLTPEKDRCHFNVPRAQS